MPRGKLQSLPEILTQPKKRTNSKLFIGKLPALDLQTHDAKQIGKSRKDFRSRKLSTFYKQTEFQREGQLNYTTVASKNQNRQYVEQKQSLPKKQETEELFQYLKVLEENEQLTEQFCYMNRGGMPYSFHIVDYPERNQNEHLTVSLRGITYLKEGESEFFTIRAFSRQMEQYKRIKEIAFFKDYLKIKTVQQWKRLLVRKKFNLKCKIIQTRAYSQMEIVQEYLAFLHSISEDYSHGNFFNFVITQTKSLSAFVDDVKASEDALVDKVRTYDRKIEKRLKSTLEAILKKFKIEERVSIGSESEEEAYLPFDSKRKSMKYTQMAKLKQFENTMYRLIRYSDFVRFTTKVNFIRDCYIKSISDLRNLKKAVDNRQSVRFTNWVQMRVDIIDKDGKAIFKCEPQVKDLSDKIKQIREDILRYIFKDHHLLIQKKESMFCENLDDDNEEKPSRFQLKTYVSKHQEIQFQLKPLFEEALYAITSQIEKLIERFRQLFVPVYESNIIQSQVSSYMGNESVKQYLNTYKNDIEMIEKCDQTTQFALVIVSVAELKDKLKKGSQAKNKVITATIPNQMVRKSTVLASKIRITASTLKQNPYTIRDYIIFADNLAKAKAAMVDIDNQLQQLLDFQTTVYKFDIRVGEAAKMTVNQTQIMHRQLTKRIEDLEGNEDKERKKFERMIGDMIPAIQDRAEELLGDIRKNDTINSPASRMKDVQRALGFLEEDYNKLKTKKQELFEYQSTLQLGHVDMQRYEKLQMTFNAYKQIWQGRGYQQQIQQFCAKRGYGQTREINQEPLRTLLSKLENINHELECYDLLQTFRSEVSQTLKIITLCELVASQNWQLEHIQQLKLLITSTNSRVVNIDYIFNNQSRRNITCYQLYSNTNLGEIQEQIKEILFKSQQQSIVKNQIMDVEQFWKKTKIKFIGQDIAENETLILHLDENEQLHQKLGYFVILLKNIENSPYVPSIVRQKAETNFKICNYLRQYLWKWQEVQHQWIKLLPLMVNCPAVKHQSNVYFQFQAVDTSLRKLIKTVNDMGSLKKLCDDLNERKLIGILNHNSKQIEGIKRMFANFLESKRATYGRFYFLSDLELINILEHVKDAKSLSKYANLCYNCERLELDGELMAGFYNPSEIFRLRKTILRGETEQIFKSLEENMRSSTKMAVRNFLPKSRISPNIQQELKQYSSQIMQVVDRILWTQMSENYLNSTSYEQYRIVLKSLYQSMVTVLPKVQKSHWLKLALRVTQMMSLREIGEELVKQQISSQDFKWKEQLRFCLSEDDIIVNQFEHKINYCCEYYPPQRISVPTLTTTRFLYESFNACVFNRPMILQGTEGEGKRTLIKQASTFFGCYGKQVICNSKISQAFIQKAIQGAIRAGLWLSFYEYDLLDYNVYAQLLESVSKIASHEKNKLDELFILVHHNRDVPLISMYSFSSFNVYEPDTERIAISLLQVYKFKECQLLATKLLQFLRVIKPFLDRIMGSQLSLMTRVINKAGLKRIESPIGVDENMLIAQQIREEIVNKEKEDKFYMLSKATSLYFNTELQGLAIDNFYQHKVDTLCAALENPRNPYTIVLGQRSCKSSIISDCMKKLQKEFVYLFPESSKHFFSSATMDYLHNVSEETILIYDANEVIPEVNDFVSSGFLFLEEKKVVIRHNIVMELRDVNKASPSFIGNCQIVYVGPHLISKLEKIKVRLRENPNLDYILQNLIEMFGEQLQNISETSLTVLSTFLMSFTQLVPPKSLHRLIVWILTLIEKETLWTKHFGGKANELSIAKNEFQLANVEPRKYSSLQIDKSFTHLIVPTKQIAQLLDLIEVFKQLKIHIHISGSAQCGKSSLLNLILKKHSLKINDKTEDWGDKIKQKFTVVRREAKNWLVDLGHEHFKLVVDDLDLSTTKDHYEYVRVLAEYGRLRDKHFNQYILEDFHVVCCSRPTANLSKYWSNMCALKFWQISKDDLESIFSTNLSRQITAYSMNKDVNQLINGNVLKAILVTRDDLANIFGQNSASSLMLGLMRNLLSLPKKQAFISAQNYTQFFKQNLHSKLLQKFISKRFRFSLKTIEQNIIKIMFNDQQLIKSEYNLNIDGLYKSISTEDFKTKITKYFNNFVFFQNFIQNVAYLVNQLHCIDHNIMLIGRKGTGKKFILQICSKLVGIKISETPSQAIMASFRNERTIFINTLESSQNYPSFYEILMNAQVDRDLEKLIDEAQKQQFYAKLSGHQKQPSRYLAKCKDNIYQIFLAQERDVYHSFCNNKRREVLNIPVCLIEEWPSQALLNIYKINHPEAKLHSQIFIMVNHLMTDAGIPTFSLKAFQKYLSIHEQISTNLENEINSKLQLNRQIYFKFTQAASTIASWQSRVGTLRDQIQISIKKNKNYIIVCQLYCFAQTLYCKQIAVEEGRQQHQNNLLQKLNEEINKRIALMKAVMSKIEKLVTSFQRTQLSELKKIFKLNKLIFFGAECLCILLGEETADEKTINKILADPNLLMKMKAPELLSTRNPRLEAKFNAEIVKLHQELKSTNNEVTKTLIQWFKHIIEYWDTSEEYKEELKSQQIAKDRLAKSLQKHKELLKELEDTKKTIDLKNIAINQANNFKKQKQAELAQIKPRFDNAVIIMPLLQREIAQTKEVIDTLANKKLKLTGNAILGAFAAVYLPLLPIPLKQKLFEEVKSQLYKNMISFSQDFMSELSGSKMASLESFHFFLLSTLTNIPKIVIDPKRKFKNFLEGKASDQFQQKIIDKVQNLQKFDPNKLYYFPTYGFNKQTSMLLVIDWNSVALQQQQEIFLRIAQYKRPDYFTVKSDLQHKITKNITLIRGKKEILYKKICQRQLKIIDDNQFVQDGVELSNLQEETNQLMHKTTEKLHQIEELSNSIKDQVNKIIMVTNIIRCFRPIDIQLILDVCKMPGNIAQNIVRWSLSNLMEKDRSAFLCSLIIQFKNERQYELLKDLCQNNIKIVEGSKTKKPQYVSAKNWEALLKLGNYSPNIKKLQQNVYKFQKQYQKWCNQIEDCHLPPCFEVELELSEIFALAFTIKPKIAGYSLHKYIAFHLKGINIQPFTHREVLLASHPKYLVVYQEKKDEIIKLCKQLNQNKYVEVKLSKLTQDYEMKQIIWKCMENKEWLVCVDARTPKDIRMLESICYYVMNYENLQNLRVFFVQDHYQEDSYLETSQQKLIAASSFLGNSSITLYRQRTSFDLLLSKYSNVEYQLPLAKEAQGLTNKQIFNKAFRLTAVCYTAITQKYQQYSFVDFQRMVDIFNYIKSKNINVQFNVFTVTQFLGKLMSYSFKDALKRRQIEQIWDRVVDEGKLIQSQRFSIPYTEDSLDKYIRNNVNLIGCEKSYLLRMEKGHLETTLSKIGQVFKYQWPHQSNLAFIRTQFGRLPNALFMKEVNQNFVYMYRHQINSHNSKVQQAKRILGLLNEATDQDALELSQQNMKENRELLFSQLSALIQKKVNVFTLRKDLNHFVNGLKKQHDFLLYFNPNNLTIVIDPNTITSFSMVISSFMIDHLLKQELKDICKYLPFLNFIKIKHQKDITHEGLYLTNIALEQFQFNYEAKSIEASSETDGIKQGIICCVQFKEPKVVESGQLDNIQISLWKNDKQIGQLLIEYVSIFAEWGLRGPKIKIY